MIQAMLAMHTALAILYPLFALVAGYSAGALAYRTEIDTMRRAAKLNIKLLTAVGFLAACEAIIIVYAGSFGWNFIRNQALLFIPLIALPLIAVGMFTMPRLVKLAHDLPVEHHPLKGLSRTKRRAAASGWLVVPVQAMTIGSLIYAYKLISPLSASYYYELLLISMMLIALSIVLALRQMAIRKSIHRASGRTVIHRFKRGIVLGLAVILLPIGITYPVIEAKNERFDAEQIRFELQLPTELRTLVNTGDQLDSNRSDKSNGFFASLSRYYFK
ncbi:hypothetical protein [Paenibacillus sp. GCM10027626]|uniref:hypothetical protein n=1 Tax=Paenibacillus sp. GCM10027626 TaxID=3273411 RepID=UPI0036269331